MFQSCDTVKFERDFFSFLKEIYNQRAFKSFEYSMAHIVLFSQILQTVQKHIFSQISL